MNQLETLVAEAVSNRQWQWSAADATHIRVVVAVAQPGIVNEEQEVLVEWLERPGKPARLRISSVCKMSAQQEQAAALLRENFFCGYTAIVLDPPGATGSVVLQATVLVPFTPAALLAAVVEEAATNAVYLSQKYRTASS